MSAYPSSTGATAPAPAAAVPASAASLPGLSYKSVPFALDELKAADGGGGWQFSGYASTFANVDLGGDVVEPGAFATSLARNPKPKLLWQHDQREPIGVPVRLEDDAKGLHGTWRLVDTQRGADAYKLLKAGAVDSLSIGFIPTDIDFDKKTDTRRLKAVDLLEVSVVSIPMNPQALITDVKQQALLAAGLASAEQHFGAYWAEVTDALVTAVARAEALEHRRDAEGRELSDSHVAALKASLGQIVPLLDRIQGLVRTREKAKADADSIAVRLELARRRLRHAGLLTGATTSLPVESAP